jgi:Na+-translocating ferredoxin:NAD+ oxidoreductase RnfG subunit
MRLLMFGALGAVLVLGMILLIGYALPPMRQGSAERVIHASPERVHAAVLDVTRQPEWRASVQSVEVKDAGWIETTTKGERVTFAIAENTPSRITLQFQSTYGYHGTWDGVLTPVMQDGQTLTRLNVTETAITPRPLGRILSRLFFDPEAFSRTYLDALQTHVQGGA